MKVAWHFPSTQKRRAFIAPPTATGSTSDNKSDPVEIVTLKSGLRVVFQKIPQVQSCVVQVLVGAGSITEPDDLVGISHFVEHMAFTGTKSRTEREIYKVAESGIEFNACTTQDDTGYYIVGHSSFAGQFSQLLLDMLLNPKFAPQKIKKEKRIVALELEGRKDSPDGHLSDMVMTQMFNGHPYGRSIMGTQQSIKSFTTDNLFAYHKATYHPKNIILVVGGDFNPDEVLKAAESFNDNDFTGVDFIEREVPVRENFPGVIIDDRRSKVAHMSIFTTGTSVFDEDRQAIKMFEMKLGNPVYSLMYRKITRQGKMAYSADTSSDSCRYGGLFGVDVNSVAPRDVGKVLDLVVSEFEKLKREGIRPEKLEVLKKQCIAQNDLLAKPLQETVEQTALDVLYHNKAVSNDELKAEIDSITPERLRIVANRIFDPKNYVVAIVGPKNKIGNISV